MPKIVAVRRYEGNIIVFFDGPVDLKGGGLKGGFTPDDTYHKFVWPEGATHYWYSEAGYKEYDSNGFTNDELGAFLWAEWVLSMQDEWSKNNEDR